MGGSQVTSHQDQDLQAANCGEEQSLIINNSIELRTGLECRSWSSSNPDYLIADVTSTCPYTLRYNCYKSHFAFRFKAGEQRIYSAKK